MYLDRRQFLRTGTVALLMPSLARAQSVSFPGSELDVETALNTVEDWVISDRSWTLPRQAEEALRLMWVTFELRLVFAQEFATICGDDNVVAAGPYRQAALAAYGQDLQIGAEQRERLTSYLDSNAEEARALFRASADAAESFLLWLSKIGVAAPLGQRLLISQGLIGVLHRVNPDPDPSSCRLSFPFSIFC